jgi:hypothetical protein
MSAGVCIMNKNAVALAADSAVSLGNRIAIHNSADKLFPLSKIASVGLIVYSCAALMGVPVEIIIHEYSEHLGDKTFPNFKQYIDDFKSFIMDNYQYLRIDKQEEIYVFNFFRTCENFVRIKYDQIIKLDQKLKEMEAYNAALKETMNDVNRRNTVNIDFGEYARKKYNDFLISAIKNDRFYSYLSDKQREIVCDMTFKLLSSNYESREMVGIAMAGYGEKDIYPSLCRFHIDGILDGKIRYTLKEDIDISELRPAHIKPLCQTDVMDTFLLGVNPKLEEMFIEQTSSQIEKYVNSMENNLFANGMKDIVSAKISEKANDIIHKVCKREIKNNIDSFYKSIEWLPIRELSLLAESLINITSIKRMVLADQNNATVGGPVDVSVITKSEGFKWLKKKKTEI